MPDSLFSRMYKNLYLREIMLINGNGANGWQFHLRIGVVPPAISLNRVTSKNAHYIFEDIFIFA